MVDRKAGRPQRNWDAEEFVCQRCRSQLNGNGAYSRSSSQGIMSNGRSHPQAGSYTHHPPTSTYINSIAGGSTQSPPYLAAAKDPRTVSPLPAGSVQWRPDPRSSHASLAPYSAYSTSNMGYQQPGYPSPSHTTPYGTQAYGSGSGMANGGGYVNGYGTSQAVSYHSSLYIFEPSSS